MAATKQKVKKRSKSKPAENGVVAIKLTDETKDHYQLHQLVTGVPLKLVNTLELIKLLEEQQSQMPEYTFIIQKLEEISNGIHEMVILWDPMQRLGSNWCLVYQQEKIQLLKQEYSLCEQQEESMAESNETALSVPSTFRRWNSLGSSEEINSWHPKETRPKVAFSLVKRFTDGNDDKQIVQLSDSTVECADFISDYQNRSERILTGTVDRGIQVEKGRATTGCQSGSCRKVNRSCQYDFQFLSADEVQQHLCNERLKKFLVGILPLIETALNENSVWDLYKGLFS